MLRFRHPEAESRRGCRICNTGSFRLERVRHFRHPAKSTHADPRVATAFGRPLRQICGLQQFSTSKRTRKCGKRRVCLDVGTRMSDLQCSFDPARTVAAFPTSSGPIRQTRSSPHFFGSDSNKPVVHRSFWPFLAPKTVATRRFDGTEARELLRPAGLTEPRPENCCDPQVCRKGRPETVASVCFAAEATPTRRPRRRRPAARCPRPQR